ncbi:MAG: sensor histidine kinase [Solirubrobacterales bacterium]
MTAHGFRHEALIYVDEDEFLAGTLPFVREGIGAGEALLVAVGPEKQTLLEAALGADADAVRFSDMRACGRNPARLIPFWRDFLDATDERPARGVGEPIWPGRTPAEIDECRRHESLLNVAFEGAGEWALLCPYDGTALDDEVLAAVDCSHRRVRRLGAGAASERFADAPDCFRGGLAACPADTETFTFRVDGLRDVRRRVAHAASAAGLPVGAAADLVAATSEVAANSVTHGGGCGRLRFWPAGRGLVVEIADRGRLREPLVGHVRPTPPQQRGRGLWLANQLCDLVQIRSNPAGTVVRLHGQPA